MGGAANCPETPRQKMIGVMYLVLTAMLALNVSSSILKGFTLVDNNLYATLESVEKRNAKLYDDFELLKQTNPQKVGVWLDEAKKFKKKADDFYNYIQTFRVEMVKLCDKDDADPKGRDIKAKDNYDIPGQYALIMGNGKKFKERIDQFREEILKYLGKDPVKSEAYKRIFNTDKQIGKEGEKVPWEVDMFESQPIAAVSVVLTKYQSDIRMAEADVLQYLRSQIDAKDFRVNKIEALVIPTSKYIFKGQKYSAKLVLAAYDSLAMPDYFVNGSSVAGGLYEASGNKLGANKFTGEIRLKGSANVYPFESEYFVSEPAATISNVDLNVVYMGIDNNFSISVPGVSSDQLSVKATGATVANKGSGRFIINPTKEGEVNISVLGKVEGKDMSMGSGVFRVKRLPKPTAYVNVNGTQTLGGLLSLQELKACSLVASYGNDALIKANFKIVSFTMIVDGLAPLNVNGSKLDPGFLGKLTKGKNLILSNIVAVGPDGFPQSLGVLLIRLA